MRKQNPRNSQRQRRSRSEGLGGDQVEGRQAVRELLLAGKRPVHELVISVNRNSSQATQNRSFPKRSEQHRPGIMAEILELANELRVPVNELPKAKFEALAATAAPQGVIARASPLQAHDLEDLVQNSGSGKPFLLVLDGVTDPTNLGAALRTAECAGVTGVVLGRHRAVNITPAAAKAAAGAIEHVPMALVGGIPAALARLAELGVWTVGLDITAPCAIYEVAVASEAVALVVGSEGKGLSRLSRERCDVVATIPLSGCLGSLNAAAAVAVGCFEIARHRML